MDKRNLELEGENIIDKFLANKKNSNCLLELEKLLLSPNDDCILSSIGMVSDLFTKIFQRKLFSTEATKKIEEEYTLWLYSRYEDFVSHLLWYLTYTNSEVQHAALKTLMLFLKLQSEHLSKDLQKEKQVFPRSIFMKIVSNLASLDLDQHHLIKIFEEYAEYSDIKLYLLKTIQALFAETTEKTDIFLENCFSLLCSMKFPANFDEVTVHSYHSDSEKPFQVKEKPFRKLFSTVWHSFLKFELSQNLLKKVLCILHKDVMPNLQNPCLLTDFLTDAYNNGGVLSLLALKGLFFLMQNHNLEYPAFFKKLYSLVDKNIINGKFNGEFFNLMNLFLSSTHLPSYIVAAFVKKLSRLSLISSTSSNLKILCLISNLLLNHISLSVLIHRTEINDYDKDPFNFDALDPSDSNAMKSSLWEIKTLQFHVNPEVSCRAKELTSKFPKMNSDISEISKVSMYTLYTRQRKRKFVDVPLAIYKPSKQKQNNVSL